MRWRAWPTSLSVRWTTRVGPGCTSGPLGEASGRPVPVAVETFHALKQRQTSEGIATPNKMHGRMNLLNWDGVGTPEGIFPRRPDDRDGSA